MPYTINQHNHRLAAWAASRAASVKGCRFRVNTGVKILEECGFDSSLVRPNQLPAPSKIDGKHREWRDAIVNEALVHGVSFTHGVAAKLINCYLKVRFVCAGHHGHDRVDCLHPPIDELLLIALAENDIGGFSRDWRRLRKQRWSKFTSDEYDEVIRLIRASIPAQPLWQIEEHWKGHQ